MADLRISKRSVAKINTLEKEIKGLKNKKKMVKESFKLKPKKIKKIKLKKVKPKKIKFKKSKPKKIKKIKIKRVKPKKIKKFKIKKVRKSVVNLKKVKPKKKKKLILFSIGISVLISALLLTLIFIVAQSVPEVDLKSSEGLASLKSVTSEEWCGGADVNRNGAVNCVDLYFARQNNFGADIKSLYLISRYFGRTDCKG